MSLPWSSKGTKATPVNADEIMILDSADANPATQNKRITVGSLASVGGEANTASNVGVGLGWFKQKTGVDLEYKSLIANSPIAAVSNVDDITLNLDALLNADISAIANIQYSKLENVSDTNILVGDATNKAAPVILSGDATIANTGVLTIANDAIDDNKIASHTSTKITINSKPQLNSNIVYTDQTQTYGAFAQIFPNTQLQLLNPAGSFQYLFATNAITANRTVSLPLLDGNDTFAFVSAIQTLANKTLSVPTIADFTNANHDHSGPTQAGNLTNSALSVGVFGSITGLGVQTQPLDMGSNLINSVTTPVSDNDAANKLYVDEIVSGLAWKDPAQVATTGNITLSGEQTIDGILTSSDRVLVKDQTSAEENGVYLSDAGAWTRTTDADTEDELLNMTISIKQGTVNENTIWLLITDEPIVVDTTELNYIEIIGGSASPLTTKGDLFGYDTGNARIPVGSNGQVLTANSAVALGVEWSSTGGGDMILAAAQTNTGIKTFLDTTMKLRNVANTFDGYFINTNTADRIYTLPDAAGVIVLDTLIQTLTNKTLTLPIISQISNTGTITIPTTTDTLVGRATSDTLTNKTLTLPTIASYVNSGTVTLPTGPDTVVGRVSTDTLTNKTIDADATGNVITNIGSSEIKSEIITGQVLKAVPIAADSILLLDSVTGLLRQTTLTSLLGGGGAQTPWTSDIDADGFDLKDLSNIEFRNTTGTPLGSVPAIYNIGAGIRINTPTTTDAQILVNGTSEYTFGAAEADFSGNNLNLNGGLITFVNTDTQIAQVGIDLLYDVTSSGDHSFRFGNSVEYDFENTVANFNNNNLVNVFLVAPKFDDLGFIADANGNEMLIFNSVVSPINNLQITNAASANAPTIGVVGGDTDIDCRFLPKGTGTFYGIRETWAWPLTNETSIPTTGVKYVTEPAPYDMSIEDAIGGLTTAGTGAALFTMDILKETSVNGNVFSSIFTTDLVEIDASEFTSTTAATQPNITTTTWEKGRRLQLSITTLDSNGLARGAKVELLVHATAK